MAHNIGNNINHENLKTKIFNKLKKNKKKHRTHILNSAKWSLTNSKNVIKQYVFFVFPILGKMLKTYLKTLKTNHLAGFGAPGVLKSDPACIFHAHWYGRSWFLMYFHEILVFFLIFVLQF